MINKKLIGKTAIVTGGSRGIGRAVVEELCYCGAQVFFTYHKNENAALEVESSGAHKIKCDQNNLSDIQAAVDLIVKETGKIDILVNNAGVTSDQYLMMMPVEEWNKVMETNAGGAFRWSKCATRSMMDKRSGAIINIASVSGLVGVAGQANYAASKGAILAFTRSLAAELGPRGIRVNAVVPGFIDTDMTARMSRSIKKKNIEKIVLQRFGKSSEIAKVISFLSSEDASYITGQAIIVDGGLIGTVT